MKDYIYIFVPFIAAISCQVLKFIFESIHKKRFDLARLFNGNGGMPSTHTSFVFSLTFLLLYEKGLKDPLFALSLVFSLVVSYDAMGIRLESERQAAAINSFINLLQRKNKKENYKLLKEELGHEPLEVLTGILFSFLISSLCYIYIF